MKLKELSIGTELGRAGKRGGLTRVAHHGSSMYFPEVGGVERCCDHQALRTYVGYVRDDILDGWIILQS